MSEVLQQTNFKLGYRPSLDGLRGVAIIVVLIFHAYIEFAVTKDIKVFGRGGFLGVDIFFVLSGFLITALLVQEWESTNSINFKKFYARRALRLLPALFVFVAVCIIHSLLFRSDVESGAFRDVIVIAAYFSNWIPTNLYSLRHTWSLAVEEQFYLIFPVFLVAMFFIVNRLKLRRGWIIFFLLLLIAAVAVHRAVMFAETGFTMRVYTGSDTRADSLIIGCLAALLVSWKMLPEKLWFVRLNNLAAIGASTALLVMFITARIDAPYMYYGGFTIIAILVGSIIISLQNSPPLILKRFFEWSVLGWIGRLSYGIYLWHKLVYLIADSLPTVVSANSRIVRIALFLTIRIVCSLIVAAASFYFIEKPFLRLKKRFAVSLEAKNETEGLETQNLSPLVVPFNSADSLNLSEEQA